ncbi:hypothetical protein [Erythrobacter litoralis]|uniref:Uncharacterized protein n=1 Tax=Erythrobacter litoralis (strain HTCC2594) TaxID=314225 RepID=Q2NAJ2_ERYLH|nr:hypothetical protein [Erythrobacter litoralis]ABC63299.1 hypothetical protein ELI_06035 [Erythrobacter litoralis HTCC2594]
MERIYSARKDFAVARSEFIDAHNAADIAVRRLLASIGKSPAVMLSANIEAMLKAPAAPQYPKAEKARIEGLLKELKNLGSIRCGIVHSRMELISVHANLHACFSNVQSQPRFGRKGLILSLSDLQAVTEEISRIERKLVVQNKVPQLARQAAA